MPLNEKLRKQWKAAGYARGHGSDAVLPPPPASFRRLYYLTGPDFAISNIVFGRIKISRFSELNDPFELLGQNFSEANIRNVVRSHKHLLNEKNGIVCFSEDWTDPVLWSHYAAKHKGIALGFDIPEALVKKVEYSPARLKYKIAEGTKSITPELEQLLISTKYESWKYEREWRLLLELNKSHNEGGLYFSQFGQSLKLVEVILGSLCDFNLKKMRDLVNSRHKAVVTYRARLAFRSYRIIPKGSTVLKTN